MRFQFGIKSILLLTLCVCVVVAVWVQGGPLIQRILVAVLLANFIGVVAALIVTVVFKIPRDGSFRKSNDRDSK